MDVNRLAGVHSYSQHFTLAWETPYRPPAPFAFALGVVFVLAVAFGRVFALVTRVVFVLAIGYLHKRFTNAPQCIRNLSS